MNALDLKIIITYGILGLHSPTEFYFALNFCLIIKAVVFLINFFKKVPCIKTAPLKGLLLIPKG